VDSERWQRVEALYYSALERHPNERHTFLLSACAGDHKLYEEVDSLLKAATRTDSLLQQPIWEQSAIIELFESEAHRFHAGIQLGPYVVEARLGAGGMGEVYRARDTRLNRAVAIKVLRTRTAVDWRSRERFQREAHAASALNHPNICAVYDVGEYEGRPYLVMECLEGQTLEERLRAGPLKFDELLDFAIQIADALDLAHSRGILHRDIKAANTFLTTRHEAKVLDFGIAKIIEFGPAATSAAPDDFTRYQEALLTMPGSAMGTVANMSPEQARGDRLDARSDLFSFGVLLYEMTTGKLPFQGPTPAVVFDAILNQQPEPVRNLRDNVPVELEEIIRSALEKDPQKRVQTAAEVRDALKALKRGSEARERSPVPLPGPKQSAARVLIRRKSISLATLALTFVIGIIAYVLLPSRNSAEIRSLAVLPLENLSGDSSQDYLAEGMTEGLITDLSKISALEVIRQTSKPTRKLAHELHADAVLGGSVARFGDRVRFSAELTRPLASRPIWARKYERNLREISELQSEVTRSVARALKVSVAAQEGAMLTKPQPVNVDAYDAYLRGRQYWNRQTIPELKRAAEEFKRSIDESPNYAPAYAGLADCYSTLALFGALSPLDILDKAGAAAIKARQLDPTLAEGQISLGIISGFFDWNWPAAEKDFKTAISLNPSLSNAHHWYAHMLEAVGRIEEGFTEIKRAHELDPLSPVFEEDIALASFYRREYGEVLEYARKLLQLQPNFWRVHHLLGRVYVQQGRFREAIGEFEQSVALSGGFVSSAALASAYAASGKLTDARRLLRELKDRSTTSYVDPETIAEVHAALGETEEALRWLDKACDNRAPIFAWIAKRDPKFDRLRNDPHFKGLLQRMRLPP